MKKNYRIFYLLILSIFLIFPSFATENKLILDGKDLYGKNIDNSVFKEYKLTMINIWGTFCSPCIKEMPDLAKLNTEYKSQGFQVIGIPIDIINRNYEPSTKKIDYAKQILNITHANYLHIIPTKQMMNSFLKDVQAVPTTIFVDKNGKIIGQTYLGAKSFTEWENIIKSFLYD